MLSLSTFSHLAAAAKNAITSRSAASTLENLTSINISVQKLTHIVQDYSGGLFAASPISTQVATLGIDIKNAISDATVEEVITVEEAQEVIAYIKETLEPSIRACMEAMKGKRDEFARAGLTSTVVGDLKDLRVQTATLGKVLMGKAPVEEREESEKVLEVIDKDFEDCLRWFG